MRYVHVQVSLYPSTYPSQSLFIHLTSGMNPTPMMQSIRKRIASIPNPTRTQTREEFQSDVLYPPRKKGRQHSPSQHLTRPRPVTQSQTQTRTRPAVRTKSPQQIQIQNDVYEKIYELERSRIVCPPISISIPIPSHLLPFRFISFHWQHRHS